MTTLQTKLENLRERVTHWVNQAVESAYYEYAKEDYITTEQATDKIMEAIRSQNLSLLDRIEKEVIGVEYDAEYLEYSHAPNSHKEAGARELRAQQRTHLNTIKKALGLTSKETEE